ncbi:MAG: glycerol-3-phosphate 1-O-acyltransferase PlsY [Chloroflexota bacterium]|nr:glycerol-3-phosphate 1-O-acyltransferase PlsY [Chloroflexota bacterium]
MTDYWWLVPLAYGAGSVQWGLLAVRALRGIDVRQYGSGKTGVTNVLRTAGRLPAAFVLLADAGKGVAMVLVARALSADPWLHSLVALAVLVGHVWPVFARFRGGRGIAPGVGTAASLNPWMALVGLGVFLPVVALTRYVSLGSVLSAAAVAAAFGGLAAAGAAPAPHLWYALAGSALIFWAHRDNLQRLLNGTERKLGQGQDGEGGEQ